MRLSCICFNLQHMHLASTVRGVPEGTDHRLLCSSEGLPRVLAADRQEAFLPRDSVPKRGWASPSYFLPSHTQDPSQR